MPQIFATFAQTMPGIPTEVGWLAPVILLVLALAAAIDARTGHVPDSLILGGIFFTTAAEGFSVDWPYAGYLLAKGLVAGFALYMVNELYYRIQKRDAFGMGDAKWTVLAISCFGLLPALFAWVIGACLALVWMGAAKIAKHPIGQVHFAPFLWIGLCVGIYWLRLR